MAFSASLRAAWALPLLLLLGVSYANVPLVASEVEMANISIRQWEDGQEDRRTLLGTAGLLPPRQRHREDGRPQGHRDRYAWVGEKQVQVNLRGKGHETMAWSKAFHEAKKQGIHEKLGLDPEARKGTPGGRGFQRHQANFNKPSRQGYYKHLEKMASDPKGVDAWHKRVRQAETMRTKPGQDRHAQTHHKTQPKYDGPVILPHKHGQAGAKQAGVVAPVKGNPAFRNRRAGP